MATDQPSPIKRLTGDKAAIEDFLDRFDTFLFDCDGVLWSGNTLYPHARATLQMLHERRKRILYLTNNSTSSRQSFADKLTRLDLPRAIPAAVFSSSYATAIYLAQTLKLPQRKNEGKSHKVFVLGERGIDEELALQGVEVINPNTNARSHPFWSSTSPSLSQEDFAAIASGTALDPSVAVVLCGLDFALSYRKLAVALAYLQRTTPQPVQLVLTNDDATLPHSGAFFPGAGACAAPLLAALGIRDGGGEKRPVTLGKPDSAMLDAIETALASSSSSASAEADPATAGEEAEAYAPFSRARTVMVGDRLETDIAFGNRAGLGGTLAVLSGIASEGDVQSARGEERAAFVVGGIGELLSSEGQE